MPGDSKVEVRVAAALIIIKRTVMLLRKKASFWDDFMSYTATHVARRTKMKESKLQWKTIIYAFQAIYRVAGIWLNHLDTAVYNPWRRPALYAACLSHENHVKGELNCITTKLPKMITRVPVAGGMVLSGQLQIKQLVEALLFQINYLNALETNCCTEAMIDKFNTLASLPEEQASVSDESRQHTDFVKSINKILDADLGPDTSPESDDEIESNSDATASSSPQQEMPASTTSSPTAKASSAITAVDYYSPPDKSSQGPVGNMSSISRRRILKPKKHIQMPTETHDFPRATGNKIVDCTVMFSELLKKQVILMRGLILVFILDISSTVDVVSDMVDTDATKAKLKIMLYFLEEIQKRATVLSQNIEELFKSYSVGNKRMLIEIIRLCNDNKSYITDHVHKTEKYMNMLAKRMSATFEFLNINKGKMCDSIDNLLFLTNSANEFLYGCAAEHVLSNKIYDIYKIQKANFQTNTKLASKHAMYNKVLPVIEADLKQPNETEGDRKTLFVFRDGRFEVNSELLKRRAATSTVCDTSPKTMHLDVWRT